jgi:tripeptidyl-peptidase I
MESLSQVGGRRRSSHALRVRVLVSHVTLAHIYTCSLKQSNIDQIEEFLMDVSHPDSLNYGKHWPAAKIADTFAPSKTTIETVRSWLHSAGFSPERLKLSATRGWIELNATVSEVERLLDAEYHVYDHVAGGEHIGLRSFKIGVH